MLVKVRGATITQVGREPDMTSNGQNRRSGTRPDAPRPASSSAARARAGREARLSAPRSSFGEWTPTANRDPYTILAAQDIAREATLVPLRHERMAVSPFTFFRGAAAEAGFDATSAAAIVDDYEQAQLRALKTGLLATGVLALLSLMSTRGLPASVTTETGDVETGEEERPQAITPTG